MINESQTLSLSLNNVGTRLENDTGGKRQFARCNVDYKIAIFLDLNRIGPAKIELGRDLGAVAQVINEVGPAWPNK
jgi:hypothetical protein